MLGWCLANPDAALQELDRIAAEESLHEFTRQAWPIVEPTRPLVDGWALGAVCEHLQAISEGQITRLLINIPPGFTKSLETSCFWPAWEWGPFDRPDLRYVCISYHEDLTIRDNRRCRSVVLSPWYQTLWGDRFEITSEQNAKKRFDTSATGWKIATSIGGGVTGERGDRVIIDDPHKVNEVESDTIRNEVLRCFTEVISSRVNDEQSAIVVIKQRIHHQDVSGLILAKDLGFEHLCLPMEYEPDHPHLSRTSLGFKDPRTELNELLCEGRYSRKYLEKTFKPMLRAWGGTYAEAGQLQQRPSPRGGGLFKRANFRFDDEAPKKVRARVRAWDLAATESKTASFTAGAKMSIDLDGRVWIEDMVRFQEEPYQMERNLVATAEMDGTKVPIDLPQDPGQAGKTQIAAFVRLLHGFTVRHSPESGSKPARAQPLASQAGGGNLWLVRGPWNDDFVNEATQFPSGMFTDQVDACSRGYARLLQLCRRKRLEFVGPEVTFGTGELP